MRIGGAVALFILCCLIVVVASAQIFRPGGSAPSATGYLPNKTLRTDGAGRIATVYGTDTDCVRVDGLATPCGSGGGASVLFVDGETPSGSINGSNAAFVLAYGPVSGSVHVFRNGVRMKASTDYTIAGATITFLSGSIPQAGDVLLVDYRR